MLLSVFDFSNMQIVNIITGKYRVTFHKTKVELHGCKQLLSLLLKWIHLEIDFLISHTVYTCCGVCLISGFDSLKLYYFSPKQEQNLPKKLWKNLKKMWMNLKVSNWYNHITSYSNFMFIRSPFNTTVFQMVPPPPPPLSMRTHHKFQKIRSFLRQKVRTSASEETLLPPLSEKCPHWTNSPPPDCGRLLWTAPY